ncbi:MAG TPA: glycoside hydrolase family 88 protein [Chitinophagaceae bacterium]|nr:glycoside hydrolase family 88 protein [Chitinophagaceae bacterium]
MYTIKKIGSLFFTLLIVLLADSQQSLKQEMQKLVDEDLRLAAKQYKYMQKLLPADKLPRSYDSVKNALVVSGSDWWCSGFYPGTLWYLYEYTKDEALKAEAIRSTALLEKEKNNTGTHDLGFMLYCSYGNGFRLTKNSSYKDVMITGARSLSTRFNSLIGCIKSWNSSRWQFPVIVDNMMNLEFLCEMTRLSGDSSFSKIAIIHANTTIKNHYRNDFSSYHVIDYDTITGKKIKGYTAQGAFDESAWARGQSWGLYGFTMMYRETKKPEYLSFAQNIADFLLHHKNMPADKIPYWDYNATDIPNTYRDASAASILCSALLELAKYANEVQRKEYLNTAVTILKNLSSAYRAAVNTNGGFILKHSVGHLPGKSEIDVPLTYADYYFIEALMRYKAWYLK